MLPAGNWKWWAVGGLLLTLWLQRRRQLVASGATPGEGGGGDALSDILKSIASIQAPELSQLLPYVPRTGPTALEQILAAENPPPATQAPAAPLPVQSAPVPQSYAAPAWTGGGSEAGGGVGTGGDTGGGFGGGEASGGTTGSGSGGGGGDHSGGSW